MPGTHVASELGLIAARIGVVAMGKWSTTSRGRADLQQFVLYHGECVDTIQNERQTHDFLHMLTGPCGRVGQQSVNNVIWQSLFNYIQRDHARQFGQRVVKSSRSRILRVKRAVQKTKVSKALFEQTEGEHDALDGGSYDRGAAVC